MKLSLRRLLLTLAAPLFAGLVRLSRRLLDRGKSISEPAERELATRVGLAQQQRTGAGTVVTGALAVGRMRRLGGHDDLDGAGDRTHVLGLLSGVHAP